MKNHNMEVTRNLLPLISSTNRLIFSTVRNKSTRDDFTLEEAIEEASMFYLHYIAFALKLSFNFLFKHFI